MSVGVCLEAVEVHLHNICQGSSVITSVKGNGDGERSSKKEGKRGNGWRNIRGGKAIKTDGKKGRMKEKGIWVGLVEWRGRAETLQGRV